MQPTGPSKKNLNKIRLYGIESDLGKGILEHIFNPKNNPLPGIYEDGSIAIQGQLDFSKCRDNEADEQ